MTSPERASLVKEAREIAHRLNNDPSSAWLHSLISRLASALSSSSPSVGEGWDDTAVERAKNEKLREALKRCERNLATAIRTNLMESGHSAQEISDLVDCNPAIIQARAALNAAAPRESLSVEPPPNPSEKARLK